MSTRVSRIYAVEGRFRILVEAPNAEVASDQVNNLFHDLTTIDSDAFCIDTTEHVADE